VRRYANFRICGIISAYAILKTQLYVEKYAICVFCNICDGMCDRMFSYNRYPYNCASVQRALLASEILNESFLKCRYFTALLAFTRWHLLLRYCYCAHVSLLFARCRCHEFYYTACIDKWPWPWLKHSLGQHESLCQVWSWSAQPFGWPLATYRQINRQT